ncbi:hypothetical protein CAOG_004726 [Capsaspora owczarzaki ATCC 30864]|uniref:Uncharacterized protein n=1 Tax=Capsaspora owczarzaki (strain ATCC 30864) TaxID=595528 RepID=A0A0D2WQP1_CAPO3|nr:hypothetical protein CAOG_004726 [Capsaspora owczarzaki ATCC 30864]
MQDPITCPRPNSPHSLLASSSMPTISLRTTPTPGTIMGYSATCLCSSSRATCRGSIPTPQPGAILPSIASEPTLALPLTLRLACTWSTLSRIKVL